MSVLGIGFPKPWGAVRHALATATVVWGHGTRQGSQGSPS